MGLSSALCLGLLSGSSALRAVRTYCAVASALSALLRLSCRSSSLQHHASNTRVVLVNCRPEYVSIDKGASWVKPSNKPCANQQA